MKRVYAWPFGRCARARQPRARFVRERELIAGASRAGDMARVPPHVTRAGILTAVSESPVGEPPPPRSLRMFAQVTSRWLSRRGIHYSWVVMGIAFLTMLVSSAALGLPGAFLK